MRTAVVSSLFGIVICAPQLVQAAGHNATDETGSQDMEMEEAPAGTSEQALTDFFLVVMGSAVYLMQLGFAMLEAGSVRSKNVVNILVKNFLDTIFAALAYWSFGWAFAYGEADSSGFIGTNQFFLTDTPVSNYSSWFFQFVFAATAATIVSGTVAERCQFKGYLVYSFVITGFIYPVVSCWGWNGEGWAAEWGYGDFAGSGIVHCVGGASALAAAIQLGPRIGRFDSDGNPREIHGHSIVLSALGGFILFWGFLAFNGGSVLTLSGGAEVAFVKAILNTALSGAAGGAVLVAWGVMRTNSVRLVPSINGSLAGLVAICAGADRFAPWAAVVTGAIGALAYLVVSDLMVRAKLDDPLDAVAVHMGAGMWGVISVGFFAETTTPGLVEGEGDVLGKNIVVLLAILAWTLTISSLVFGMLRRFDWLRVSEEVELKGLDTKHMEHAYILVPKDIVSETLDGEERVNSWYHGKDEEAPALTGNGNQIQEIDLRSTSR